MSLRRLMGWQAPGFEHRLKCGVVLLANLAPGDFVFFSAYTLAGLVPPVSSFFPMLLEFYGLQLQHLSPNSITLVVIFVHLSEMFVGVRLSVRLFRRFFVMKAVSQCPPLIGGYYFARRTQGPSRYIAPVSPGRWERWREDWVMMQADAHDRLVIPAAAPTLNRAKWGKDPGLESGFDPVLDRIQYLAESGLTSLMVLHDFLSRRLAPLQDRATRLAWMYTMVNDIMRLERGPGSSLDGELLAACLKALTTDQFSAELATPLASCGAICMDHAARTALLAAMPTLDDVDITVVQRGDLSRGVTIPGATVTGGRGGTTGGGQGGRGLGGSGSPSSAPALGKGKGVSTRVVHDDDEVSSDEDEPLQVRLRSRFPAGGSSSLGTASPVTVAAEAAGAEAAMYRRAAEEAAAKEVAGRAHQSPARCLPPQRAPRWRRRQVAHLHRPNGPTGAFGDLSMSQSHCALFRSLFARLITSAFRLPDRHRRLEHPV
jgi:hypothetical protein